MKNYDDQYYIKKKSQYNYVDLCCVCIIFTKVKISEYLFDESNVFFLFVSGVI